MSLSSLIVQRGIATIREVEEALARQVLYGGDLVTNLLEVTRVDEANLLPIFAESVALPPAPAGELPRPSPDALRMVAAEVAHERNFAPLAIQSDALVVAVSEPLDRDAEQELTFALAMPIEQRAAPLHRVRQALARDYGVPIDRRLTRLLTKLVEGRPRVTESVPPPRKAAFEMKQPPRAPSAPPPLDAAPPVVPPVPAGTLVRKLDGIPARPVKRRRGPLTVDVAKQELEEATERDTIFALLFEFARQFFDYTALFFVQGEVAEGRDAFGDGASRDKIALIGVPLDVKNILGVARETKKVVRAVPSKSGLDPILMADLGRSGTTECVVVPVVVRTRVVALVFGDGGASGVDEASVKDVVDILKNAASAFERLIVRRKLKGGSERPRSLEASRARNSVPPITTSASRASRPPPRDRPSAEELAPPIRELMSEPQSRIEAISDHDPAPEPFAHDPHDIRSDEPPPANLLAVRKLSGAPIPREEPESATRIEPAPATFASNTGFGTTRPSASARLSGRMTDSLVPSGSIPPQPQPPKTRSGALRRAEAPPLDFGAPSGGTGGFAETSFDTDETERQLLAQIEGRAPISPPRPASALRTDARAPISVPPPTDRDPNPLAVMTAVPARRTEPPLGASSHAVRAPDLAAADAILGGAPSAPVHPALSEPPYSPKAESPPPMRAAAVTDVSLAPLFPPWSSPHDDLTPLVPPISMDDPDATPLVPRAEVMQARAAIAARQAELERQTKVTAIPPVASPAPAAEPAVTAPPATTVSATFEGRRLAPAPASAPKVNDTDPMLARPILAIASDIPPRPMPASEQQISVPAHRPPSSHDDRDRVLPSVIVDVASEYVSLVDRVLAGADDEAEESLLRAGGHAMPAIMAKFPGPIAIERERLATGVLPPVRECGPILRLVATQRRTALPFVLAQVNEDDPDRRFWSTYLLSELVYPDAIDAAVDRVFDTDPRVRRAAKLAARALAEAHPTPVVERLAAVATDTGEPLARRVMAIEAMGESREPSAIASLIPLLHDIAAEIVLPARQALMLIARQDFGVEATKWTTWWTANKDRHRLEWLIDALMHDQAALRAAASEELKTITKEYFGYYDDLPKRERERAKERYREWWNNVGRVRFSRASSRG